MPVSEPGGVSYSLLWWDGGAAEDNAQQWALVSI